VEGRGERRRNWRGTSARWPREGGDKRRWQRTGGRQQAGPRERWIQGSKGGKKTRTVTGGREVASEEEGAGSRKR